jgi:hypothetical protein
MVPDLNTASKLGGSEKSGIDPGLGQIKDLKIGSDEFHP